MNQGKYRFIASFLVLPLTLYGVFVLSPYAQGAYISLTSWTGFTAAKPFVGLANYRKLVHDPSFWNALEHNALVLVVLPVVTLALGLFLASMLNVGGHRGGVRGSGFYKRVYYLPNILPLVLGAVLWEFIYNPQIGLLNSGLKGIGLSSLQHSWLGDPTTALWAIVAILVWGNVGFYMLLFSAALQGIPRDIYEAAEIDGAGRLRVMLRITLPLLRNTVQVGYIYLALLALDMFTVTNILTPDDGPDFSTRVIAKYLYDTAFQGGQFGYASAIGVAMCVLTLIIAGLTFRVGKRETIEF